MIYVCYLDKVEMAAKRNQRFCCIGGENMQRDDLHLSVYKTTRFRFQ